MLHTIITDITANAIAIAFWLTLGAIVARRINRAR